MEKEKKRITRLDIILCIIYAITLYVLNFRLVGTIYDAVIWIVVTLFFKNLKAYIGAIKYFVDNKKKKNNKSNKKYSISVVLKAIKLYGIKEFISLVMVFFVPLSMFIFLVFVGIKVNYKADIDEFEKIVSSKCPLIKDNIHNLENVNKILITDENICGYEIGFIIVPDGDEKTYQTMLNYIKYEIKPYIPGGIESNLFNKEYSSASEHYKSIYKHGNNIVYAIAPMDKKDEASWIIRELGYTSIPSFENIFN